MTNTNTTKSDVEQAWQRIEASRERCAELLAEAESTDDILDDIARMLQAGGARRQARQNGGRPALRLVTE